MIDSGRLATACLKLILDAHVDECMWLGGDKTELQKERIKVEKAGPGAVPMPESVREKAGDIEIILVHYCPISSALMSFFPKLKIIGVARGGAENVDLKAATGKGILLFRVAGRNAHAVSDFAIGLMLSELRNIVRSHLALRSGHWRKEFLNSPHQLEGKQVGIVGVGAVGSLVAKKLSGFGVRLVGYDPALDSARFAQLGVTPMELGELMKTSDVVTLHARLTPDTQRMIGRREIWSMKPEAILVNTARAGLIDGDALVEALETRRIGGAALDVFDPEPLPSRHPLLLLDNVTLTSHLAGTTVEALDNAPRLLCQIIRDFLHDRKIEGLANAGMLTVGSPTITDDGRQ